jgi:hypothetical protein
MHAIRRWRAAWARTRRRAPAQLDRRTLADLGLFPGAVLAAAQGIGLDRLRRPPHV